MGKGNKKKKTQNVQRPPMHIDEPKFELDVAPVQISDGDKKFKAQQERERREQEREIQLKKELIEQEKKKKNKAKPKQNSQKNKSQSKDNETKNQEELAVKTDFKRDTSTSRTENIRTNNTTERYQTNNNVNRPSYSNTKSFGRINYNYNKNDKDYEEFLHSKPIKDCKVIELKGDLFDAPEEYSLAHCVAEDFSMGAGIAKEFRARFKKVGKLLDQNQKTGGLAILEDKDRFIYYLVTKPVSRGKPTLYTLWKSVLKLQEHIIKHKVTKLAIPQIGCGLDRLDWNDVKQMLEFVFQKIDIEIAVYILDFQHKFRLNLLDKSSRYYNKRSLDVKLHTSPSKKPRLENCYRPDHSKRNSEIYLNKSTSLSKESRLDHSCSDPPRFSHISISHFKKSTSLDNDYKIEDLESKTRHVSKKRTESESSDSDVKETKYQNKKHKSESESSDSDRKKNYRNKKHESKNYSKKAKYTSCYSTHN